MNENRYINVCLRYFIFSMLCLQSALSRWFWFFCGKYTFWIFSLAKDLCTRSSSCLSCMISSHLLHFDLIEYNNESHKCELYLNYLLNLPEKPDSAKHFPGIYFYLWSDAYETYGALQISSEFVDDLCSEVAACSSIELTVFQIRQWLLRWIGRYSEGIWRRWLR